MYPSKMMRGLATASLVLVYIILTIVFCAQTMAQGPSPEAIASATPLSRAESISKDIQRGERHYYSVEAAKDQFVRVVANQQGVDVIVAVFSPSGSKVTEVDSPNDARGPEPASWIATDQGKHIVEVRFLKRETGDVKYVLTLEDLRPATIQDEKLISAEKLSAEGLRLVSQVTAATSRSAIVKYEEAGRLFREIGDQVREASALNQIGAQYMFLGESQKALEYFSEALKLRTAAGDQKGIGSTLNFIGNVHAYMGDNFTALNYYNRALTERKAAGDRTGVGTTLHNIAYTESLLGNKQQALDYYKQALEFRIQLGNSSTEALTRSGLGLLYVELGDSENARAHLNRAIEIRREAGNRYGEAYAISNLGTLHERLGEREKALELYSQALELHKAVGDERAESAALFKIATLEKQSGKLQKAREHIERSLEIIEGLRTKAASQQLRESYSASVQSYYELYIDVLMRLNEAERSNGLDSLALHASERARARSLLDLLTEASVDIRKGVDPVLLAKEKDVQQALSGAADQHARLLTLRTPPKERLAAVSTQIMELAGQLEQIRAQIRQVSPRYATITQPSPLRTEEIQALLDQETVLLEYSLGEERSFLWAVTNKSVKSWVLPSRMEIEAAARKFYSAISRVEGKENASATNEAATQLARLVLLPARNAINSKRILVVSDGALQYISFDSLPVSPSGSSLITKSEVVTLPSASALHVLRHDLSQKSPAPNALAIFADPVFSESDSRLKGPASSSVSQNDGHAVNSTNTARVVTTPVGLTRAFDETAPDLATSGIPRLPFSRREAEAIFNATPDRHSVKALDFGASKAAVIAGDLSKYRIIHFATHGLLNSQNPELSGIVLSLVDEKGKPVDGFVRLNEIYNLDLSADLVVLSACQTGLGKEIKGEGLIGLTRGFMYAGAQRVVASLWKVDDAGTAELMKTFYLKMFRERMRPAAALRAAKVEMSRDARWKSPYYWAAFQLQGEWK